MKYFLIVFLIVTGNVFAKNIEQTEITTDDGIEVFQNEKYYLLKKNVIIKSPSFTLTADLVKAFFDKDLYDVTKIESEGNSKLTSQKNIQAIGDTINFSLKDDEILILGKKSSLIYVDIKMYSNESIHVINKTGEFFINGDKSKLKTNKIEIMGDKIDGKYNSKENFNDIEKLFVQDKEIANIITETMNLFSKKATYNKETNIIELFEKVKIIRENEVITGDYAEINTERNSYKIKSNNNNKVKALIINNNE
jgi:lipopolysaccharide export system protein LptA